MFSTTMTGALSAITAIERKQVMLKTGVYSVMLDTLVKIDKLAKVKVPKDTGLLRQNIRISIMADWGGKRVSINNTLVARGKRQREAKARIKRKASTRNLERWLNNVSAPSSVHGVVYNVLPYARVRDRKGGIGKPAGYLTNTGRLYKIIFKRKLLLMSRAVGRR